MDDNPFAVLTLIAAPAVLTNASSVLALGTSNRFARALDRQRQLSSMLDAAKTVDSETLAARMRQLERIDVRAQLLLRALTNFYVSLGSFAAASLVSLFGAGVIPPGLRYAALAIRAGALLCGVIGVSGLVIGCTLLVRETRLALQGLREEADFSRRRHSGGASAP